MRQILGEDLNVGCVLTWGPCWYYQKQFFAGKDHPLSTPEHLMRYDVEVSGFPSSHAGHLFLLRLKEQDYPGTTKHRGLAELGPADLAVGQVAGRRRRLRALGLGPAGLGQASCRPTRCRPSTASAPTSTSST